MPSLKDEQGQWTHDPTEKANLLKKTFVKKSRLPPEHPFYDVLPDGSEAMPKFTLLRTRWTKRILKNLVADSATGPDRLPARILRECADALALPITLLVRLMLSTGTWPKCWKIHWVLPLHKKGPSANPSNYRGVHLTTLLSKVTERLLNTVLTPFLQKTGAFGASQFAFQKGLSANDLVAAQVCSWILALTLRKKIGVYLSDISGAFDKVETDRLLAKLTATGINSTFLQLLRNYLTVREAYVLVNGEKSCKFELANTVFQGTVLGPSLWNIFFKDVTTIPALLNARVAQFADDLTVTKEFPPHTPNAYIMETLRTYQDGAHKEGK